MKTANALTQVTKFIIHGNEWIIVKGNFDGDTEHKYPYGAIRREWITGTETNRKLTGAQMCVSATIPEVIEKVTDFEEVNYLVDVKGLDHNTAVASYFSKKFGIEVKA